MVAAVRRSITRTQANRQCVPAPVTAVLAAQLPFQVNQPHVVRSSIGQPDMVDNRPMPANRTGSLNNMPNSQMLQAKGVTRRQGGHSEPVCVRPVFCTIMLYQSCRQVASVARGCSATCCRATREIRPCATTSAIAFHYGGGHLQRQDDLHWGDPFRRVSLSRRGEVVGLCRRYGGARIGDPSREDTINGWRTRSGVAIAPPRCATVPEVGGTARPRKVGTCPRWRPRPRVRGLITGRFASLKSDSAATIKWFGPIDQTVSCNQCRLIFRF
jgi:hypothetical protein